MDFIFKVKKGYSYYIIGVLLLFLFCMPIKVYAKESTYYCGVDTEAQSDITNDMKLFVQPHVGVSQGMCVADGYIITTKWTSNGAKTTYYVIDADSGEIVNTYQFQTSHSNSLTYNPDKKEVVTCYGGKAYLFSFKNGELEQKATKSLSHNCPKIAYVEKEKAYYLGTDDVIYKTTDFSNLYQVFEYEKEGINQGMGSDGEKLYVNWFASNENLISVYDLSGDKVKTFVISNEDYKEVEEVDFYEDKLVVNVISSGKKNGIYYAGSHHKYSKWEVLLEASCVAEGEKERTCSVCKYKETERIPISKEHKPGPWKVVKKSECGEPGEKVCECDICGKQLHESTIPDRQHKFSEWETIKESTVLQEGEQERHCIYCQKEETKKMKKLEAKLQIKKDNMQIIAFMNDGDYIKKCSSKNGIVSYKNGKIVPKKYGEDLVTIQTAGGAEAQFSIYVSRMPSIKASLNKKLHFTDADYLIRKSEFVELLW